MRGKIQAYYGTDTRKPYLGDCLELLRKIKPEGVDMISVDPLYFLSSNGITCQGGGMISVNGMSQDEGGDFKENHIFNRGWIRMCRRVLKSGGAIWISGTLHNTYSVGTALRQERYEIINNITWKKTNPPPNLAYYCLTHSIRTTLWARKDEEKARHLFNYEQMKQMNGGRQIKDVREGNLTRSSEERTGRYPTQKPEHLLERIILTSTRKGDVVLDPFCGSGTAGMVSEKCGRQFTGTDSNEEYLDMVKRCSDQIQEILKRQKEILTHGLVNSG